ncbi:leukocyte immunoglobulin-like receptor subfamily B member 3 [Grammomys surdaster]|uniref:leukocyte immunoglobulin-like receptor subfamily B member 3 n=1 Tax=Grammomys surdaster TaxID=491861 RepID=UPI00109F709A|nr:leukocyte immunoglobulin-like receptor subfamily B member 3 [Grammomys surdaster]
MAIAFIPLVCLGLNLVPTTHIPAETIGKPTLKAHPGSVITRGMQVTMSCEGTSSAQEHYLCKEGSPDPCQRQSPMGPGNKAEFFFPSIQQNHAGRYHCYYQTHVGWSENSDSLDLMVTGLYRKPRLSVLPSLVVRLGGNVTLQCVSQLGYDGFVLTNEESQKFSLIRDSQYIYSNGQFRALFSVGPVTSRQRRTFRCYGYYMRKPQVWSEPSDPQELLFSGVPEITSKPQNLSEDKTASQSQDHKMENVIRMCLSGLILTVLGILLFDACCTQRKIPDAAYRLILESGNPVLSGAFSKPTIKVVPSNVVTVGQQVTIFCEGSLDAKEYRLHKEGSQDYLIPTTLLETENKAKFSISPIQWNHAGQYWCSCKSPTNMFLQSDIMELVVTGVIQGEVTLSALPSYVVTSGGNVTLQCASQVTYDMFILLKEDEKFSTVVPSWQTYPTLWRALFTVGPVTSIQRWRFRCYGYYLSNSQMWSKPSNHLELLVSGPLPKPVLWAHPGSMITSGSPVTIWCKGDRKTQTYMLHREGSLEFWDRQFQMDHNKAKLTIPSVTHLNAGRYSCYSYTSAGWSEPSDTLELVVTGVYKKPTISVLQSPVVNLGVFVNISCTSNQIFNWFILRNDDQKIYRSYGLQYPYSMMSLAWFQVGPITSTPIWRFRCYGYYTDNPQMWSEASDPLEFLVSGNLQKPTLWSEPGSVIQSGNSVTIWCEGTMETNTYFLYKEGNPFSWLRKTPKEPGNKAMFFIASMGKHNAGQYRCYCYNFGGWSQRSDTLELMMTDVHHGKPTLSAFPSPMVTSGVNVTLQCASSKKYDWFILTGQDLKFSRSQKAQFIHTEKSQALFSDISMASSKKGPFRCYGYNESTPYVWSEASNPLEIHVSGLSRKPSLLNQQGPVLTPGDNLTLQCSSETSFDRFALSKAGRSDLTQLSVSQSQTGQYHANFTLGSVDFSIAGQYRCYGASRFSSEWSAPSVPQDILVTGHPHVTPNLSVHPGTIVSSGENVTLLCQSSIPMDTFFLFKDGAGYPYLHQRLKFQEPQYEAEFFLSAVTPVLVGIYTCFGSQSSSPYLLSHPSVPVEIKVSGLARYQKSFIWVSVVFLLLLFVLTLFFLRLWHQKKHKKGVQTKTDLQHPEGAAEPINLVGHLQKSSSLTPAIQEEILYATVKVTRPADSVELDILGLSETLQLITWGIDATEFWMSVSIPQAVGSQSQHEDDMSIHLYAQVKPARLRRAQTTSSSLLPKELHDSKHRHINRDQVIDEQADTSQNPHAVTYAQLHFMTPVQASVPLSKKKMLS